MTQQFSMRIATQADSDVITNSRKADVSFAPLIHSDSAIQHWINDILIPNTQVWLVEQDKVMIGMMAIIEKKKINWIDQLYTFRSHNGHGITI
jgi:hypothetical protein